MRFAGTKSDSKVSRIMPVIVSIRAELIVAGASPCPFAPCHVWGLLALCRGFLPALGPPLLHQVG